MTQEYCGDERADGCGYFKTGKMSLFSVCTSLRPCGWRDGQALKQAGTAVVAASTVSRYMRASRSMGPEIRLKTVKTQPHGDQIIKRTARETLWQRRLTEIKSFKELLDMCDQCTGVWKGCRGVMICSCEDEMEERVSKAVCGDGSVVKWRLTSLWFGMCEQRSCDPEGAVTSIANIAASVSHLPLHENENQT